jgi:hypothetical protein
MKIPQLQRIKIIFDIMNDCQYYELKDIVQKVNDKLLTNYCKSTIEKDMDLMRMNLDADDVWMSSSRGVKFENPIDFFERLKLWLI